MTAPGLSWVGIFRLGLVNSAMGAVIVLATTTLNRVMVVEWALPATIPGLLVGLHYGIQILRPRLGHASDVAGRRTPWIIGGVLVLALGGFLAAFATAGMGSRPASGIGIAVVGFIMIGLGSGAAGTALMALLARQVEPARRPAAATVTWLMMIVGFVVTAGLAGLFLDPFSPQRLIAVSGVASAVAFTLALLAVVGLEGSESALSEPAGQVLEKPPFKTALAEVWADTQARRFTIFVFISMLAQSGQNLILEPFAGIAFGFTPGQSTRLASVLYTGVLAGMILVGAFGRRIGSLRAWTIGGCIASALALLNLTAAGLSGPPWPLQLSVLAVGLANGAFAVSALGMMMALAGAGRSGREGLRMGLWGTAQAFAMGLGGFVGAAGVDLTRIATGSPVLAFAVVFALQALLFAFAARLIAVMGGPAGTPGGLAAGEGPEYREASDQRRR